MNDNTYLKGWNQGCLFKYLPMYINIFFLRWSGKISKNPKFPAFDMQIEMSILAEFSEYH